MPEFDTTWFKSIEEKEAAVAKAREILESVDMYPPSLASFLEDDELVWSVCCEAEEILAWNDNYPASHLSTMGGACDLKCALTDMS